MAVLYLMEQGATVRLRGGRVRVELDDTLLQDMPARKVRLVSVQGNVRLRTVSAFTRRWTSISWGWGLSVMIRLC
jgi:hypothetical protein